MKLWLDDIRRPPDDSWEWCSNGHEFRDWLHSDWRHTITHISFDHDIATYDGYGNEITGYTCLCWVEKLAFTDANFELPEMTVHSANPVGRQKMQKVIDRLNGRMRLF